MPVIIIFFVIGLITTIFGLWEQKTRYSDKQFAYGTVVAHKSLKDNGNILTLTVHYVLDFVVPIVEFKNSYGCVQTAPLHLKISRMLFAQYPEFDIGGTVSVSFFGDSPRECYLENHCMSQTVIKLSVCFVIGIALLVVAVLLTAYYISI